MASIQRRPNGAWRARYRDDTGREHSRHFDRKTDAKRWIDEVTTSLVTGQYVDPRAGRVTFGVYAEQWRASMPHRDHTRNRVARDLRLHVYPVLGDLPLARIRPSTVQGLMSGLTVSPASAVNVFTVVRQVLRAAQRDRVIATDPSDGVKLPKAHTGDAWIPDPGQVAALRHNLPPRFRGVVDLVVGSGLRQAEVFGLELSGLDFLRGRSVTVSQQLLSLNPVRLGPPKSPESRREVPLAPTTLAAVSAHLAAFPIAPVELADHTDPRAPRDRRVDLVFTTEQGQRVSYGSWGRIWRAAAGDAGFPKGSGLHSLRHFYASLLIRYGESAKVVQRRLGHSSVAITLETYTHLWPDSEQRTRDAVEDALGDLADRWRTG